MNSKVIESIIKNNQMIPQLKVLEKMYSTSITCYKQQINEDEFEAYSTSSHTFNDTPLTFNGILGLGDFHQTDLFTSSGFESIPLYTSSDIPSSGDKIEIENDHGVKRYIVDSVEQYGKEKNVFFKYVLSGIEE